MKKFILSVTILIIANGYLAAQGNSLVFNQVLTFSNANITSSPYTIATVPTGKVWKIEYMGSYRSSYPNSFAINTGSAENDYGVFSYGNSLSNPTPHGPIWLKEGDVIKILNATGGSPATYFISIIEFNIVPL
jgi:hypothetical protein